MKNLCDKSKGKIHPTHSSSSSSLLDLLPHAIRSLVSTKLPPQDIEILSYLIKTKHPTTSNSCKNKSQPFDCSCFDCYTSFWARWDSSPNRNLIHQALDAFEQQQQHQQPHLPKTPKKRYRRVSADKSNKPTVPLLKPDISNSGRHKLLSFEAKDNGTEVDVRISAVTDDVSEDVARTLRKKTDISEISEGGVGIPQVTEGSNHQQQGLVRKVWPGVLGFLNFSFGSFWSTNV